jgi:toxic protein SymE
MTPRRLTISSRYPNSRARPSAPYVSSAPMPFLRLQGRWLDQAGFAIGAQVRVEVDRGRLVVEVIDAEPAQR